MKRVSPGKHPQFSAGDWNELAALSERMRRVLDAEEFRRKWDFPFVKVRNESGADRNRGEILRVIGPAFDFSDGSTDIGDAIFGGGIPYTPDDCGRFVVLLEPVKSGKIARAMLHGLVKARVNIVHASHRFADVTDGDCSKLTSRDIGGAQIVAAKSGTGTKWAWVRVGLPVHRPRYATLTDELADGVEGNATLDDTRTIKVKCRLLGDGTLPVGTICEVIPQPHAEPWIVIAVSQCVAEPTEEDPPPEEGP